MTEEPAFSQKEKALVSLAASVAAGCQPCTAHHVKAGRAAGACERSLALAVETALAVRASAAKAMDEWVSMCQGERPAVDPEFATQKRLLAELEALAAAVAVNSVPDLKARLTTAAQAGATPEQVGTVIKLAKAIQKIAEQKLDAALGELLEPAEPCCASTSPAASEKPCTCN